MLSFILTRDLHVLTDVTSPSGNSGSYARLAVRPEFLRLAAPINAAGEFVNRPDRSPDVHLLGA